MSRKTEPSPPESRCRQYMDEFKREAVQMLLDGHSAASIAQRLGIADFHLLYRWRAKFARQAGDVGDVGDALDARVKTLEAELRRVEREQTF